MPERLTVPRLRIRKDWYQNLAPDPTDHSHPDLGVRPDAQDGTTGEAFDRCSCTCIGFTHRFMVLLTLVLRPEVKTKVLSSTQYGVCRAWTRQCILLPQKTAQQ